MPHELLPARTPEGIEIENLIKEMYQVRSNGDKRGIYLCWLQIMNIASKEGLSSLKDWMGEA